jgi:hypothetical protein
MQLSFEPSKDFGISNENLLNNCVRRTEESFRENSASQWAMDVPKYDFPCQSNRDI